MIRSLPLAVADYSLQIGKHLFNQRHVRSRRVFLQVSLERIDSALLFTPFDVDLSQIDQGDRKRMTAEVVRRFELSFRAQVVVNTRGGKAGIKMSCCRRWF